jgi:hypothetical protein
MTFFFQYIRKVMRLRFPEDGSTPRIGTTPEGDSAQRIGIDMTENGIFLGKDVHWRLGRGLVAFIKV